MKKIKLFALILLLPLLLTLGSCNQAIFARMSGTVGIGAEAIWADIGFDGFTYTATGSDSSFKLNLRFDNLGSEFIEFSLAPANSSGSTLSAKYAPGVYPIDGSSNSVSGQIAAGLTLVPFTSSAGQMVIEILNFNGGNITGLQGTFDINLEEGGRLQGTFSWQG